jgi:hypothetical protein
MRKLVLAAVALVLGSLSGLAADSFRADATATGTVVLWFAGQEVTAHVRASVAVSGTLVLGDMSTPFSLTGRASGSGDGNTNTLAVDGWIALRGEGETESGVPLSIQGGISIDALGEGTTSTAGQGSGHFYLIITAPDSRWIVEGDAVGSASGAFVVPDDPYSMQMQGSGVFTLSGEPREWSPVGDTALPDWPAELLEELEQQAADDSAS